MQIVTSDIDSVLRFLLQRNPDTGQYTYVYVYTYVHQET
jgi:hypothetical protein